MMTDDMLRCEALVYGTYVAIVGDQSGQAWIICFSSQLQHVIRYAMLSWD